MESLKTIDNKTNTLLKTDWLGSEPIFYNTETKAHSSKFEDVFDLNNFEIDLEGLILYLEAQQFALGTTYIKNVKYLLPDQALSLNASPNSKFIINSNDNYDDDYPNYSPEECLDNIIQKVKQTASQTKNNLLPLSGGYDSRALALGLENESNVYSRTFSYNHNDEKCQDVKRAKLISEKLGFDWGLVPIVNYHQHLENWMNVMGAEMPLWGLFTYPFYQNLQKDHPTGLIHSGIMGDYCSWAFTPTIKINSIDKMFTLFYPEYQNKDINYLNFKVTEKPNIEEFWKARKDRLDDPSYCELWCARTTMMRMGFNLKVPESLGLEVSSPYLSKDVFFPILNLPRKIREHREWQETEFERRGFGNTFLGTDGKKNRTIESKAMQRCTLPPLATEQLREYFSIEWLNQINKDLTRFGSLWNKIYKKKNFHEQYGGHRLGRIFNSLISSDTRLTSYKHYMLLYPLSKLLEKRAHN